MKKTAASLAAGLLFALAGSVLPAHAGAVADSASGAAFKALYTEEWQWRMSQRLEDEEDDVNGIRPDLPRIDAATQQARLAYWQRVLARLDAIPVAALAPAQRIDYAVYRAQIAALIENQRFREYEKPLNSDSAFWSNIAGEADKTFRTEAEYAAYVQQLNDMPRYFAEATANMRAGLKRGFTPPRVTLQGRDKSVAAVAEESQLEKLAFYRPFKDMPAAIPAARQAELRAAALKALRESVVPAHQRLPDGKAYYQSKITEYTTTALSAEQIHQTGLDEMAKIRAEMMEVIKQVGFQGGLPEFLQFLRTDPRFYARTPDELLMRAAYVAKRFDGKVANYFGYLPRSRFAIIPVAPDIAPYYTSGRGGPGVYMVNTYNLPARPLYSLPALTLHESAPGHAFQMPIALEQKGRPAFRNAYISAYGEGWALYTERLGVEMGIYETPYEIFGMLSYQAWRASRLVVDTGVHAKGWSREQAQAYLRENTALSEHEIATEVDRYISWPGQALSYYLGQMAILEARKKAEAALGPKFDIRAFHDTVLNLGSVPLPVLHARIDAFIAEGGKSPYPKEE